jgi:hypothetical protein
VTAQACTSLWGASQGNPDKGRWSRLATRSHASCASCHHELHLMLSVAIFSIRSWLQLSPPSNIEARPRVDDVVQTEGRQVHGKLCFIDGVFPVDANHVPQHSELVRSGRAKADHDVVMTNHISSMSIPQLT